MESLHVYREILGLFDIIILTSIIILSISLYVSYKKIHFIIITISYFFQVIVSIYIDYYDSIDNLNSEILKLLLLILVIKAITLIWFSRKMYNRNYINILLTIVIALEMLCINYDYVLFIITNIISNIIVVRFVYIESIKNIMNKFIKNKHKLNENRQFISKSIEEMESQANLNDSLNKSINNLNNKIKNIIEYLDIPVFILDSKNNYIYGNKEFEKLLIENNYSINNKILSFFKNEIINFNDMEKSLEEYNDDFIELKSNKDKFKFKCSKDNVNGKEIKLCILINNSSGIKTKKEINQYKNKLISETYKDTYNTLLQKIPDGIAIIDKTTKIHKFRNKVMIKILKNIGVENLNEIITEYINEGNYRVSKDYTIKADKNIKLNLFITDFIDDDNMICYIRIISSESIYKKLNEVKDMYSFKNEFLYTISKNLKDPINTIFESNKRLQKSEVRKKYKYIDNYSRVIKQNSYRLKRLLDNIEEINKIENGIIDINYSTCDIIKFIESIVNVSREYAKLKNIDIIFYSNVKKKVISIDESKIERIILNLLSNALKFTSNNGKIIVSINVDKDETTISVEDTGIGIENKNLEIIFDNFVQLDTTLSRGCEGTGIGLALVRNIAKIHDAKINVYSEFGEGSKFELKLKNLQEKEKKKDKKIKYNFAEMIDIEFSDIYFDLDIEVNG